MAKPLAEILEELHELSEELRPHVEGSTDPGEALLEEQLQCLREDLEAYRAKNRELTAARDRRDVSLKHQAAQIEELSANLTAMVHGRDQELRDLRTRATKLEERAEDLHVLAARLGSLLERWHEETPIRGAIDLRAETRDALLELEALGPAPGTPVPCREEVGHG